eukprot:1798132-Heterocapsa_arctica.AAC.1
MAPRMIIAPFGSIAHRCSTDFELASGTPCPTQVHLDHARQLKDRNYSQGSTTHMHSPSSHRNLLL